jgi:hypothetical protein
MQSKPHKRNGTENKHPAIREPKGADAKDEIRQTGTPKREDPKKEEHENGKRRDCDCN